MKKLSTIITLVRDGSKQPTYEELRYAVCAMEALSTFDTQALSTLARGKKEGKVQKLIYDSVYQFDEHFGRWKRALDKDPKEYIGWNNDPENPEFLKRRRIAKRLRTSLDD